MSNEKGGWARAKPRGKVCDQCGAEAKCVWMKGEQWCPGCLNPEPDEEYLRAERDYYTRRSGEFGDMGYTGRQVEEYKQRVMYRKRAEAKKSRGDTRLM